MKTLRAFEALGPIDVKNVLRDPLLRWVLAYPLLIAGLIRWGLPWLAARLEEQFGLDVGAYHSLLASFVLLMTPMLAGMVIGFLLLDQKDDETLTALQVTPLTLNGYLAYRISMPVALSFFITLLVVPATGLVKMGLFSLLLAAVAAAPLAPFYALVLAGFASNKVQGFALTKAMGVLLVPPVAAFFVPAPWQWLFGVVPLYWPAKLLWALTGDGTGAVAALVFGLIYQSILLWVLLRHFNAAMRR